jgi:hypothetical protein
MGTKSREVIYGGRVRAAKMNADRARKLAVEAAREADRAEAHAFPAYGGLWRTSSALANHRAMSQRGLRLARGEVPQMRDPGQYPFGCRPPISQHADLEAGGGVEMPVVPNAAVLAARAYDQVDRNSRDRAVPVGSPGR